MLRSTWRSRTGCTGCRRSRATLRCKISLLWCQLCPHIFEHQKLCRISSMTLRSTWMARTWWWGCRRPRMTSWIEIDYVVFEYDTWYVFVFGVKLCQEKSFGYIFMSFKQTWRSWTGWRGFTGPRLTSKEWNCNLGWSEGVFFYAFISGFLLKPRASPKAGPPFELWQEYHRVKII